MIALSPSKDNRLRRMNRNMNTFYNQHDTGFQSRELTDDLPESKGLHQTRSESNDSLCCIPVNESRESE